MNSLPESWHLLVWLGPLLVAAAGVATYALILALRPLLLRYALARPNARSSHRLPTPQGGGAAIVAVTLVAGAAAIATAPGSGPAILLDLSPLFAATFLLAAVGAIDDIRVLGALPRLGLQALAVGLVVATLPEKLHIVPVLPWWLERALLLVAGLWFVNLVNFMDGLDWMTLAEMVPICGALVLLGAIGVLPPPALLLAMALLGALLGFAPFNKPVARLFLGDVGSLPIGLLVGWLLVQLAGQGHVAAAVLLPLYYLADATLTLLRRLLRGENVMEAHRSHFYQRATDHGWTVSGIVTVVFALNLTLAALALLTIWQGSVIVDAAALGMAATLVAMLLAGFARKRG